MYNIKNFEKDINSNQILISVIIPVYNVEPYLTRCLDSVLGQEINDMEIICVNDGSTDNSLSILQDYANKYSCIHVINQPNGGLVKARKAGLLAASGKYVSHIDSDDWIESGMYADMLEKAIACDADVVTSRLIRDYGNYVVADKENFEHGLYTGDRLLYEIKHHLIETDAFFKGNIDPHITNKLYRREILLSHQMNIDDEISIGEDVVVVYPLLLDANRVVVMLQAYYHYCIRMDSIMGHPSKVEAEKALLVSELLKREFNRHPEVTNGMQQCRNLITYEALMSYAPSVVMYQDEHLSLYGNVAPDEKLVIYGAGKLGQALHDILQREGLQVIAWADKNEGYLSATDLLNVEFDKILIAVANYDMIETIRMELTDIGIPSEKVLVPDTKEMRSYDFDRH